MCVYVCVRGWVSVGGWVGGCTYALFEVFVAIGRMLRAR